LASIATTGTKTAFGIIQLWFNYFAAFFGGNLAITFAGRLKREMFDSQWVYFCQI